jgi:uncharacterized protein YqeY
MEDPRVRLQADLKDAMRDRNRQRITVIRMALNAIKQDEIDRRVALSAEDAAAILQREAKKRRESITDAEAAGRADVVESEQAELAILEQYLPPQLTEAALTEMARAAIAEVGATSPKAMGDVMRVLMPRLQGQADGKVVNQVVRDLLSAL